jgi:hypothetical protein
VISLCDSVLQPGSTLLSDTWTYSTGQQTIRTFDVRQHAGWWIARTSCEGLYRYSNGRSFQLFIGSECFEFGPVSRWLWLMLYLPDDDPE